MRSAAAGAALVALSQAAVATAADLAVTVDRLRDGDGHLLVSVFDRPATWLEDGHGIRDVKLPARRGSVTFTLRGLPPGRYGIVVLHDENDNGHMDYSWAGLPEEGYAFSRNVRPFLSAPSFASAAVMLAGHGNAITIHMVYP